MTVLGDPKLVASDPAPARALRATLAAARANGADFGTVWPMAVKIALGAAPTPLERTNWRHALNATEPEWRAAYEGRPELPACGALSRIA